MAIISLHLDPKISCLSIFWPRNTGLTCPYVHALNAPLGFLLVLVWYPEQTYCKICRRHYVGLCLCEPFVQKTDCLHICVICFTHIFLRQVNSFFLLFVLSTLILIKIVCIYLDLSRLLLACINSHPKILSQKSMSGVLFFCFEKTENDTDGAFEWTRICMSRMTNTKFVLSIVKWQRALPFFLDQEGNQGENAPCYDFAKSSLFLWNPHITFLSS